MQNKTNPLIFVVEDNQIYNKLVVSYLKTNKFTNVEAYLTGEEVLKNMHKNPDIVIQDYLLDGMTGIEVLIKAKKICPNVEFIFLSGNDNIDIAINSMKYGAYNYIVKDQMALQKTIQTWCYIILCRTCLFSASYHLFGHQISDNVRIVEYPSYYKTKPGTVSCTGFCFII
jgi:CheY-like chemotaxis protein